MADLSLPLVSIVTPSFNQARYLEAAIQSVLAQEYPRIEYLVVDGASTDGSVEIIRQYQDRLAYWVSARDSGQADAINKGLRRATGKIVAWLNSDDLYLPGAIQTTAEVFEQNPEAGMVFGNVASIDERGQTFNLQTFKPVTLPDLMAFYIISQPAVFMRRSVLEEAGYLDPTYHLLLDHHLWIRMARLAPLVYIPQTLAAARYHPEAKNIARAGAFGAEAFRILEWMHSDPAFASEFAAHRLRIHAGAHRLNAYYLVEAGNNGRGLAAYARAFFNHPLTVLKDWKRVAYAGLGLLGMRRIRDVYIRIRQRLLERGR
jgi:glycosyltransferase involved in cell wall biosynthesis